MSDPRPLPDEALLVPSPDQLSTEVAEEVVLLGLRRGRYYSLDTVGARVWQELQAPTTFGALVGRVVEAFDVDDAAARRDLSAFIRELEAEGLVEIRPPAA